MVVILGAGITGMSAACRLAQNGIDVVVIEKEPNLGGLACSTVRNGATFDFGAHAFVFYDEMKDALYSIVGDSKVNIFEKNVKIKFGGKYYQYPLDAIDILLKSNPMMTLLCLVDYIIAQFKLKFGSPIDDSAESWIINRFGKSLYKIYFENYTEKVWGIHPRHISPSFTEERIPLLNIPAALRKTVKGVSGMLTKKQASKSSHSKELFYPEKGLIFFFKQLEDPVLKNQGVIHHNSEITGLQLEERKVKAVFFEKEGEEHEIECDYVISTIPINDLINSITPKLDDSILTAADLLKFRALIFVNLLVKREEIFDSLWIYFRDRIFNRVSEMNKFSNEIVPDGRTALVAEITCDKDDELWSMEEAKLCNEVVKELEEEGFIAGEDVCDAFVTRYEHGYPVADLDYERNRKLLHDFTESTENLFVAGRQGLFRYLRMDQCMKLGFSAAEQIISGKV